MREAEIKRALKDQLETEAGGRLPFLEEVQIGVVRRNPRNFRQPSSSPATSASRSMNLPSVWKV